MWFRWLNSLPGLSFTICVDGSTHEQVWTIPILTESTDSMYSTYRILIASIVCCIPYKMHVWMWSRTL